MWSRKWERGHWVRTCNKRVRVCARAESFQLVAVHLPQSGDQLVEARELSAVLSDVSSNPAAIVFGRGVGSTARRRYIHTAIKPAYRQPKRNHSDGLIICRCLMVFTLEMSYRITSTQLLFLYWMIVQSRIGSWVNFPTYMFKINTYYLSDRVNI